MVHGIVLNTPVHWPFYCSMSPNPFTSHHYFAADINLTGTDTLWLIKLTDQEIFDCLCVLVCVWAPACSSSRVLQQFMGWCHSYAALPSRDLQNSHLRFYAVWQSPVRGHQGRGGTTSFMAQTNLHWCQAVPGTLPLFRWCSRKCIH